MSIVHQTMPGIVPVQAFLRNHHRIRAEFDKYGLGYLFDSVPSMRDFLAKYKASMAWAIYRLMFGACRLLLVNILTTPMQLY